MPKIMEIIEKETKGKSYHTYKYSYDSIGLPSIDYDDDPNKVMKWKDSGETGSPKKPIDLKSLADQLQSVGEKPLLKYFLDGSRHVFKVDDIAYNKQVFPVVAGQIGIGCCKRENKRMSKERFYRELVLALPDKANADGWDDAAYFAAKVKKLNESEELKRLGLHFSAIIPYSTSKAGSPDTKLDNLAVGVIQDYMIEAEKRMVAELVKDKRLGQDAYLLKDGSLEYVFGDAIRTIYDLQLGQYAGEEGVNPPSRVVIFIDELNKYASKETPKNSPILRQVLDVAERGRSLGVVLFAAEQFRSAIHDRVTGNCSTHAYGRTNSIEVTKSDYKSIPSVYKTMMTRLKQGEYIIQNPIFRSLLNIKFPKPIYKQFK